MMANPDANEDLRTWRADILEAFRSQGFNPQLDREGWHVPMSEARFGRFDLEPILSALIRRPTPWTAEMRESPRRLLEWSWLLFLVFCAGVSVGVWLGAR